MKIEHLEYFVKVAQCGSINKAAAQLFISQPHLSRIIKDIEDDAGIDLLCRTRSGVSLTPEGEVFLSHCLNVLEEMSALSRIGGKKQKGQTLCISMTRSSHVMESFIDVCKAHEAEDSYSFVLNEGSTLEVVNDVLEARADIGVFQLDYPCSSEILNLIQSRGLVYHSLAVMRPHIVISANHALHKQNLPITLDCLADFGMVRYDEDYENFTYQITVGNTEYNLNESPRVARIHDRASLLHLISSSNFFTLGIQNFDQQLPCYDIVSIPVDGCEQRLEFAYIHTKEKQLSPTMLELIENLKCRFSKLNEI